MQNRLKRGESNKLNLLKKFNQDSAEDVMKIV